MCFDWSYFFKSAYPCVLPVQGLAFASSVTLVSPWELTFTLPFPSHDLHLHIINFSFLSGETQIIDGWYAFIIFPSGNSLPSPVTTSTHDALFSCQNPCPSPTPAKVTNSPLFLLWGPCSILGQVFPNTFCSVSVNIEVIRRGSLSYSLLFLPVLRRKPALFGKMKKEIHGMSGIREKE